MAVRSSELVANKQPWIEMKKATTFCLMAIALELAGCATASKDITAAYVSPMTYQNYDCAQLNAETQRVQQRVVELGGRLDQASSNDKALVGASLLFWPALFALGGTKQQEAEYGRLKGEYEAVQRAGVEKKCAGIVSPTPIQAADVAPTAPVRPSSAASASGSST